MLDVKLLHPLHAVDTIFVTNDFCSILYVHHPCSVVNTKSKPNIFCHSLSKFSLSIYYLMELGPTRLYVKIIDSNKNVGAIRSSFFFKSKDLEIELCIKSLKEGKFMGMVLL